MRGLNAPWPAVMIIVRVSSVSPASVWSSITSSARWEIDSITSPSRTSGSYCIACSVSRSISSWPFTFGYPATSKMCFSG